MVIAEQRFPGRKWGTWFCGCLGSGLFRQRNSQDTGPKADEGFVWSRRGREALWPEQRKGLGGEKERGIGDPWSRITGWGLTGLCKELAPSLSKAIE